MFFILVEVQGTAKYFFTLKRRFSLVPNYWIPKNFTEAVGPSSLSLFNNVCFSSRIATSHTPCTVSIIINLMNKHYVPSVQFSRSVLSDSL